MTAAVIARHEHTVSPALALTALVLVVLTAVNLWFVSHWWHGAFVVTIAVHAIAYIVGIWWVLNRPLGSRDLLLILSAAIIIRLIAFPAPQSLTTDAYRYVWDGRIQWHGFNPFLWVPAAPELEHLRDEAIYPHIYLKEIAVTIYPPVAEILFMLGNAIHDSVTGVKIVMAGLEILTVWALMRWLDADGLPRERVLIYAWHPLPLWEFTGQAHIDSAATAFLVAAILLAVHKRQGWAGLVLGVAALTKYFPVVLIPALWKRWNWRMPAAFVATAALLYLPYAWHAGPKVIGFFGDLMDKEGYIAGYGFHVIWLLRDFQIADLPGKLYIAIALVILSALGAYVFFNRGREEIRPDDMVLLAFAFIWLTSPHHVWYFGWIIPLLCRHLSLAALSMTLLAFLRYSPSADPVITVSNVYLAIFAIPLLIAAFEAWRERKRVLVVRS
jgi:alpha-1,6-mannosyltransferase